MNWRVVTPDADLLGETPFWHPPEGRLYWSDIPGKRLRRMRPGEAVETWDLPQECGCMAPAESGGLVLGLRDGIYRARTWGGPLVAIVRFGHAATTRFNDGKADALGRFWAGTIYEPKDARKAELYCIDCRPGNGERGKPVVQVKAINATTANGLAWSPDSRTLYWTDTPTHAVSAWDWEPVANVLRRHRVFHQFPGKPAEWQPAAPGSAYGGRPDGAAVDENGDYWCAMFEGGRIVRLSPEGVGRQEIPLPARFPTMPCFGGPDRRTLYVTTASRGRPEAELAQFPQSGHVFALDVDVRGLPVQFFVD